MTIEAVFSTRFEFLPPKQFYRKIEEIFQRADRSGSAENFALTFARVFHEILSRDLGVSVIQVYEQEDGYPRLLKTWGDSSNHDSVLDFTISRTQELPWIGDLNHRKAAIISANEDRRLLMVFLADECFASDETFLESYISAFSSLHYALAQNLKWFELQDSFEQARSIQKSLLPSRNPQLGDFDIAALSISAREVGGDVFDFQNIRPDVLSLTIADAAGHGLAAALQARDVITGIRMGVASEMEISSLASTLNRVIHQSGLVSRFVSVIHGELSSHGWFRYINAGHLSPLLRDGDHFRKLKSTGMILGPQAHSSYQQHRIYMSPGSALILYTDGVTEHLDQNGVEFGIDGLKSWIRDWRNAPASMALKALIQRLYDFGHGKPFHDDVTAVYICRPQ